MTKRAVSLFFVIDCRLRQIELFFEFAALKEDYCLTAIVRNMRIDQVEDINRQRPREQGKERWGGMPGINEKSREGDQEKNSGNGRGFI